MEGNRNSNLKVITSKNGKRKKTKSKINTKKPVSSKRRSGKAVMSSDERKKQKQLYYLKMKKRRRIFVGTVLLLILIIVGIILSLTVFFNIQKVQVVGKTIYKEQQIIDSSGIKIRDNLIVLNKNKVSKKIRTDLPYIGTTTISKKLPSTVVINVKPTVEKAKIELKGKIISLNEAGKVLKISEKNDNKNVTLFKGLKIKDPKIGYEIEFENDESKKAFLTIIEKFQKQKLDKISYVDLSKTSDIKIMYDDRILINLGDTDNIDQKLELGVQALKRQNEINPKQKGNLDLTVDKKAFFRPTK